jgi:restriction system protein
MDSGNSDFIRYFGPMLDALRSLGGSGTPREVASYVAQQLHISEEAQTEQLRSGESRFINDLYWARAYLRFEGYIDASKRGVWVLTASGRATHLSYPEARAVYLKWRKHHQQARRRHRQGKGNAESSKSLPPQPISHREAILSILKSLPPAGLKTFVSGCFGNRALRQ